MKPENKIKDGSFLPLSCFRSEPPLRLGAII